MVIVLWLWGIKVGDASVGGVAARLSKPVGLLRIAPASPALCHCRRRPLYVKLLWLAHAWMKLPSTGALATALAAQGVHFDEEASNTVLRARGRGP